MDGQIVNITIDTNVLIRLVVQDDEKQAAVARDLVTQAGQIIIPLVVFCEAAWVLTGRYEMSRNDVADMFETIIDTGKIQAQRRAVEAGIGMLRANGDFADAAIAFDGQTLGAEVYATFDRKAAALIGKSGMRTRLL
jgi:predicted nucleic-acid-binding protein